MHACTVGSRDSGSREITHDHSRADASSAGAAQPRPAPPRRAFGTVASDDPANGGERRYDPRQRRLAHEADYSFGRSWRRADKRWRREPRWGPGCKTQGNAERQGRSQAKRPNVVGLFWSSGSLSAYRDGAQRHYVLRGRQSDVRGRLRTSCLDERGPFLSNPRLSVSDL